MPCARVNANPSLLLLPHEFEGRMYLGDSRSSMRQVPAKQLGQREQQIVRQLQA